MDDAAVKARLTILWETPRTLRGWFATVDHKELGLRYIITAFFFLILGGLEALLLRIQLSQADMRVLSPGAYNQVFTMHGATMIFWYASPILSRICRLPGAFDDWRARHGVPASKRLHLLGVVFIFRRPAQFSTPSSSGASRRLVCLRTLHFDPLFAGSRNGHLCTLADTF